MGLVEEKQRELEGKIEFINQELEKLKIIGELGSNALDLLAEIQDRVTLPPDLEASAQTLAAAVIKHSVAILNELP